MLKGFKEFLAQGNIVDLAVAVVIGAAFTTLVKAFTDQVIQPLISSIGAGGDHSYGVLRIHLLGDNLNRPRFSAVAIRVDALG